MALLLSNGLMDVVPQFAVCTLNRGQEGKTFSHSLGRKHGHCRAAAQDPYAYLKDILTRLPTQRAREITELLPHK